ncbi:MAG: SlyX family protein [Alphaproteobacteria bacterium]|nr:SlyX family protein [Alphaproteobacteria bacterium]
MEYTDLNHAAWSGTAANLVKLLKAFGKDEKAVDCIQKAVNGQFIEYWKNNWGDRWTVTKNYQTPAVERELKRDIMADFYAKQGVFDPNAPKPDVLKELSDKFNAQAQQIEELKRTVAEQQKTIDTLKKNPPEYPSTH